MQNPIRFGYCRNCEANTVHARLFGSRLLWLLDRATFAILGRLNLGPWRCVDCGRRNIVMPRQRSAVRTVQSSQDEADVAMPIGNVLRTQQSLVHARSSNPRFSEKYLRGVVQKLLSGETTVSQVCRDLEASELEVQGWIKLVTEQEQDSLRGEIQRLVALLPPMLPGTDQDGDQWQAGEPVAAQSDSSHRGAPGSSLDDS